MNKNNMSFKNKTAIVTGSTRGIGKSIADMLADLGCQVIYTGTKATMKLIGPRKKYIQLDLSDDQSIEGFIAKINKLQKIDILVNNAGINIIEPIDQLQVENWNKILKVNLTGPMLLMREVSAIMKRNKRGGKILNVSSIFGVISRSKRGSYSASKTGLIGLTRAAALDLGPFNILVNALCPGVTLTDLTRSILSKKEMKAMSADIPLKRMAGVEEIANAAVFLCSDMNTYITGQEIVVDGGLTVK